MSAGAGCWGAIWSSSRARGIIAGSPMLSAERGLIAYSMLRRRTMRSAGMRFMAATLVLLPLAACFGGRVEAPEPPRDFSRDTLSFPPLPPGTIIAPLTLDRQSAVAALEGEVPRKFGKIDQRIRIPDSRKSFAFEVTREPFTVSFAADTIVLTSVVHYRARGWLDAPIGPDIEGGCGMHKQPHRARLQLRVARRFRADRAIQVRTRVGSLLRDAASERDQCKASYLDMDAAG